jgi:hypothetical protein
MSTNDATFYNLENYTNFYEPQEAGDKVRPLENPSTFLLVDDLQS